MNSIRTFLIASLVFFGAAVSTASADTVVDIALSDDNFSSLVDAVSSQGLVSTLQGHGPFTVFAPTNDAFAALPSYVADVLADNPDHLTDILLYHVVAGELLAADVVEKNKIKTVQGEKIKVSTPGSKVFLNQSEVVLTDLTADNGVVHVIDQVLIPNKVYKAAIDDLRHQIRDIKQAGDNLDKKKVSAIVPSKNLQQLAATAPAVATTTTAPAKVAQISIPKEPVAAANALKKVFNSNELSQIVKILSS